MPTTSEFNQFRRLIGDYGQNELTDNDIISYLDDAVRELTADFDTPVAVFDTLVGQYKPEVVVWAARNYWWQKAGEYAERHSQTVGNASHQASEKWDRAIKMIELLESQYEKIGSLGTDITFGNISRFSKQTLSRLGGQREEISLDGP